MQTLAIAAIVLGLAKWGRLGCMAFVTIVVGSAIAVAQANDPKDDITGTVSKAEPPTKQDGTRAHPYADASECPPSTDMIFWPKEGRSIPSIPPSISVCFVGDRSSGDGGPNVEVRDR
jgi:hypothetical protein